MGASVDASSTMIEAMAVEEARVEDAGMTALPARSGATSLVRTTGKASLARAPRETIPVKTILRALLASLRCHHHQEGTTTTTRTRGLWASRSLAPLPASWVALRP